MHLAPMEIIENRVGGFGGRGAVVYIGIGGLSKGLEGGGSLEAAFIACHDSHSLSRGFDNKQQRQGDKSKM